MPTVVPDEKLVGGVLKVELGHVDGGEVRPPVSVGDEDVRRVGEMVRGGAQHRVARLTEILEGVEEYEPARSDPPIFSIYINNVEQRFYTTFCVGDTVRC